MKPHQCARCGEQFQDQKTFYNLVIKEHNAPIHVARKYKIKTNKNHPDLQEGGGNGQVSHTGTGVPKQT